MALTSVDFTFNNLVQVIDYDNLYNIIISKELRNYISTKYGFLLANL